MYYAIDIAKYIFTYADSKDYSITNLRLQKLLYFVYKEYLKQTGQYLFKDIFYAWEFGPVIHTVYKEFENTAVFIQKQYKYPKFEDSLIELINGVVEKYSQYPIDQLIYLSTLSKSAWEKAFNSKSKEINPELIKKEL